MTWLLSLLGVGGIGLALAFIPGVLPAVIKAATAVWDAICDHPREAIILALCGACVWLWLGWGNADDRADTWKRAHDIRVRLEERAEAEQKALNAAHVAKAKEAANHADEIKAVQTDRNRLAAAVWTERNRVRGGSCGADQSHPAPTDRSAGVSQEAAPGPDLVAIPASDMTVIADNLSYAQACYAWGQELVAKGVAK